MRLNIIAKTKAKKNAVVELTSTTYEVSVTAAPTDGKANTAIIKVLADHLNLHPNKIIIKSVFKTKNKVVDILDG